MPKQFLIAPIMMIAISLPSQGMSSLPSDFLDDGLAVSPFILAVRRQEYQATEQMLNEYMAISASLSLSAQAAFQSHVDKALWECVNGCVRHYDESKMLALCKLLCAHHANPNGFTYLRDKKFETYTHYDDEHPEGITIAFYERNPVFTTLDVAITNTDLAKKTIHPTVIFYLLEQGARGCRINDPERDEFQIWRTMLSQHTDIKRSYAKSLIYKSKLPSLEDRLILHFVHDQPQADVSQIPQELQDRIIELRKLVHSTPTKSIDTFEFDSILA